MFSSKTNKGSQPPIWLDLRSSTWFICTIICIATFTDGFAYGAIVPILPFSLVERSRVPENEVQFWISTLLVVHGAAMAIFSPVAGWLADRSSSRKSSFFVGLAMLFIATLTFALGTNPITLVIARFLQGASAGIVYTVGLALLVDTVGRDEVGTWMGFALSGMSTGVMVGPFLGGIIYAKAGYFAVFAVMLGVIAFDFVLRLFMIEKKTAAIWRESSHGGNDYGTFSNDSDGNRKPGDAVFGEHEESSENSSINSSGSSIEEDPIKQVPPELAPASLTIPYRPSLAKRFKKRFVSQFPTIGTLLGSSRLIAAMYGGFINISLICSFDSILPLFVHKTFGWDSSGTGIIFLAITIPSLGAPLVGALSDRLGSRVVVLSGFVISALALALMMIVQHDSLKQIILLCGLLALTGIGTTLMLAPLAADMFAIVEQLGKDNKGLFGPAGAYAQAYGLFDTALACGTMFGPAFVGFMYGKVGWKVAVLGLAVFCVSGCVPVIFFTGSQRNRARGKAKAVENGV